LFYFKEPTGIYFNPYSSHKPAAFGTLVRFFPI
jgi:hypothetical protein